MNAVNGNHNHEDLEGRNEHREAQHPGPQESVSPPMTVHHIDSADVNMTIVQMPWGDFNKTFKAMLIPFPDEGFGMLVTNKALAQQEQEQATAELIRRYGKSRGTAEIILADD
jgi:hypothetical protein